MNTPHSKQGWLLSLIAIVVILAVAQSSGPIRAQGESKLRVVPTSASPSEHSAKERKQSRSLRGERDQKTTLRLREGTSISDEQGHFDLSGDGATFVSRENHKFGGLPNLNLERVLRMLAGTEEPGSVKWSVSGMVTEFDGKNYLLITRAVYKSNSLPPAPERVSE